MSEQAVFRFYRAGEKVHAIGVGAEGGSLLRGKMLWRVIDQHTVPSHDEVVLSVAGAEDVRAPDLAKLREAVAT